MAIRRPTFDNSGAAERVQVQDDGANNSIASNLGTENDIGVLHYNGGNGFAHFATLSRRSGGTWSGTGSNWNSTGDKIYLPARSTSMASANLIPGWSFPFQDAWSTGTLPNDVARDGTFGGAWYASSSGTVAGVYRYRTGSLNSAMAFFSCTFQITALPETNRFLWIGQSINQGNTIYGLCLRVDSLGACTLRAIDTYAGPGDATLDSGMTVALNDWVLVERFGARLTAMKTSGNTRAWLDADETTSTNRPLNARVGLSSDGYANSFAATSFGLATDSTSLRINTVRFAG